LDLLYRLYLLNWLHVLNGLHGNRSWSFNWAAVAAFQYTGRHPQSVNLSLKAGDLCLEDSDLVFAFFYCVIDADHVFFLTTILNIAVLQKMSISPRNTEVTCSG